MAKFGYNVSTIWTQRDVYFTSGNMQGKYNKRNFWIEISDETIPKPKIRQWIKWFQKHSHSFIPSIFLNKFISKKWVKGQLISGVILSFLDIIVTDTVFAF